MVSSGKQMKQSYHFECSSQKTLRLLTVTRGYTGFMLARSAWLLLLTFIVAYVCASAPARASDQAITQGQGRSAFSLSEVIELARRNSPHIRQMEAKVAAAVQRERGAGAIAGPSVSLAQHAGRDTGGLDEDVLVTQIYELGNKRRNRARAARAETAALRSEKADAELDLENAARTAYFEALRADADRKLAMESFDNAQCGPRSQGPAL